MGSLSILDSTGKQSIPTARRPCLRRLCRCSRLRPDACSWPWGPWKDLKIFGMRATCVKPSADCISNCLEKAYSGFGMTKGFLSPRNLCEWLPRTTDFLDRRNCVGLLARFLPFVVGAEGIWTHWRLEFRATPCRRQRAFT